MTIAFNCIPKETVREQSINVDLLAIEMQI